MNDVDSIASLVFPAGWVGTTQTHATLLQPATTADYDVYVYTTEVIGILDKDVSYYPPITGTTTVWEHIWNNYYFEGGGQVEGVWSEEEAPVGFSKVSEYSWTSTSSNDFPVTGHLNNNTAIANYSDLYFAMKVENGLDIYIQGGALYEGGDWLYVHMYQAENGTWSKDFRTLDGSYSCIGKQTGLTGTNLVALMGYVNGVNTGSFPRLDKTAGLTATAYFTEVIGIPKDGNLPDVEEEVDVTIPRNAVPVRTFIWRDDKYTDTNAGGSNTLTTEGAPEGFGHVLKHQWSTTRTYEYTYCFDETLDITQYSDLYFATKIENGTRIYIKNSDGHYEGKDGWVYAHYTQVSEGVWSASFTSLDGYHAAPAQTISSTTLKGLVDGNFYGVATAGNGTITYWTEVRAIPYDGAWGDRVIWSAVDGAAASYSGIGMPSGFTAQYKFTNFTVDSFASLDLTNTNYQELRFAMLADKDFTFNAGYKYTMPGEDTERPTTSIMYNTGSSPQMYVVNLTNNGGNSWTVTMNVKRWVSAPAGGGSSAQIADTETFTATVTGNSLQEIMSTFLTASKGMTLYCTEVRGEHTCAYTYIYIMATVRIAISAHAAT